MNQRLIACFMLDVDLPFKAHTDAAASFWWIIYGRIQSCSCRRKVQLQIRPLSWGTASVKHSYTSSNSRHKPIINIHPNCDKHCRVTIVHVGQVVFYAHQHSFGVYARRSVLRFWVTRTLVNVEPHAFRSAVTRTSFIANGMHLN